MPSRRPRRPRSKHLTKSKTDARHATRRSAAPRPRRAAGKKKKPAPAASPTPAMSEKQRALYLLKWAHETTGFLIADFPADRATFMPSPTDNHLLWTIGHLATAYDYFAMLIDGQPAQTPGPYNALFGSGSTPTPDEHAYPALADVRAVMHAAFARLISAIEHLPDNLLHADTAVPSNGFAKDRLDAIHKALWHEGWHQGQLSSLRRALGLGGRM